MMTSDQSIHRPLSARSHSSGLAYSVSGEHICIAVLALLVGVCTWRIALGQIVLGQDSATQFYPWYSYLGERLRDFDIPSWNPAQFSGVPFAADPQSGWSYLPAMVFFTVLPLAAAIPAFVLFHFALSAFGTYCLARALGLAPLGSLMAGGAYLLSGPVFSRSVCCPAQSEVVAWAPIILLGIELGLRKRDLAEKAFWLTVAAVALSQIYAAWLGQGAYYAVLLTGSYVIYRGLIDSPVKNISWRNRLFESGAALVWIGGFSVGLGAAGILPRIEYNGLTNVAGGSYNGLLNYAADNGGWTAGQTIFREFDRNPYYMGGIVIALATTSLILSRGRKASPFFSFVMVVGFVLASSHTTPLHRVLYLLLPKFKVLHEHWPERIALVSFLSIAILAGIAIDALADWQDNRFLAFAAASIPMLVAIGFTIGLQTAGDALPWPVLLGVGVTTILIVGATWKQGSQILSLAPVLLILIAFTDLLAANTLMLQNGPYGGYHAVSAQSYFAPSNAGRFLQSKMPSGTFRYFGYDPRLWFPGEIGDVYYRHQFGNERTQQLEVNNRAIMIGLQDVQGYNPVQYQPYVDFLAALNGQAQDYHDANILPSGVESPLLNLLAVKYILVPSASLGTDNQDLDAVRAMYPTVFDDGVTAVLQRPNTLPYAWVVHESETMPTETSWNAIASGQLDPGQTATLDQPAPTLVETNQSSKVKVLQRSPEKVVLSIDNPAAGMLVLSELAYPDWKASIDGEPVETLEAFGLLRSVHVGRGSHVIEFRYDDTTERIGVVVSLMTVALLVGTFAVLKRKSKQATAKPMES